MKKIIVTTLAAVLCTFSTFAFSWGGVVDNTTKLGANNDFSAITLKQGNGVYLSINSPITDFGKLKISAEGLYRYEFDADFKASKGTFKNIADIDLLKCSGEWVIKDGNLSVSAGRFIFSDFSGSVFAQESDGVFASYDMRKMKFSAYTGYTGLLNRLNVSMTESEIKEDDQLYALCPKYVPVMADFSYKTLFDSHTIGVQLAGFIPLSDDYTMKAYSTVIMNGYIGTFGSYDAKLTFGTEKLTGLMIDAKADANFYFKNIIIATVGGEYVSGRNGNLKPFLTISSRSFGSSPFYNGVIIPKVAAVYAKDKLYVCATERIMISMNENDAKFDGFDTAINAVYNIFSDLQVAADMGAYICTETKALTNYYITAKASLAF